MTQKQNILSLLFITLLFLGVSSKVYGINMESLSQIMKIRDQSLFVFLNSARSFDKINKQYGDFINEYDTYIAELNLPASQVTKIAMTNTDDDGEIHETERLTDSFGVDMDYAPHIVFIDKKMDKFKYNGSLNPKELKQFIDDARLQKVPMFYRSQQIPQEPQKCLLKKVVANNFHQKVWYSPEQILLYIYRQDCSECSDFQSKLLKKVIDRTKTTPNLLYYKIDSSLNELLGLANLNRQPYVLYFTNPKDRLPPYFDESIVSADKIIAWMKQNSKIGINDPIGDQLDTTL